MRETDDRTLIQYQDDLADKILNGSDDLRAELADSLAPLVDHICTSYGIAPSKDELEPLVLKALNKSLQDLKKAKSLQQNYHFGTFFSWNFKNLSK